MAKISGVRIWESGGLATTGEKKMERDKGSHGVI
jgi:hypothetical protein